jgi:hypothetical protein
MTKPSKAMNWETFDEWWKRRNRDLERLGVTEELRSPTKLTCSAAWNRAAHGILGMIDQRIARYKEVRGEGMSQPLDPESELISLRAQIVREFDDEAKP